MIFAIGNLIKAGLKKKGASRGVNQAVSIASVALMTVITLGILCTIIISGNFSLSGRKQPIATYDISGWTMEVYDDTLPLEIEDLSNADALWSKESDYQETFLLTYNRYNQDFVLIEGNNAGDTKDLQYNIIDIKIPWLVEPIQKAVLNSRQDEKHGDFVFTDHYEEIDPTVWNADAAYQLYWSDSYLNTYLIFWNNRILEIKFYWEPTPQQIQITVEKLQP